MRVTEKALDELKPELVRIEWPQKMYNQLFDARKKLTLFVEFDQDVDSIYKQIKFSPIMYLKPVNSTIYSERIYSNNVRLSIVDRSSLIITFKHNQLRKGTCYNLKIDKRDEIFSMSSEVLKNEGQICTTNCQCNEKGTASCTEESGVCMCHSPYTGVDCS